MPTGNSTSQKRAAAGRKGGQARAKRSTGNTGRGRGGNRTMAAGANTGATTTGNEGMSKAERRGIQTHYNRLSTSLQGLRKQFPWVEEGSTAQQG